MKVVTSRSCGRDVTFSVRHSMVRRRKPAGGFKKSGDAYQGRNVARGSAKNVTGIRNDGIPLDDEDLCE